MKKTLKIGIIGIGNIGSAHASSIYSGKVPEMTLAALCDNDEKRANELRMHYPDVPVFENAEEMMKSGLCEAVIVSTPHYFHPPIAIKAFSYGLHVLTEKPGGVTCSSVREMMDAARKSGKAFAIMFNQRTNKLFARAREIMASGELGELKRVVWIITNWYRNKAYYDSGSWRASWSGEGGGVLMNQAPHNLDLGQWICGMPAKIYAKCDIGKYHEIEVEDDATIIGTYPNGAIATFITTTGEYPGTNRLEISGSKGKLVIEAGKMIHSKTALDETEYRYAPNGTPNPITVEEYADEKYNGHVNVLKNFAAHILRGEPLVSPGYDAINEITLCNAAYLSSWTQKEIELPMDDGLFERLLAEKIQNSDHVVSKNERERLQEAYKDRWNTNW